MRASALKKNGSDTAKLTGSQVVKQEKLIKSQNPATRAAFRGTLSDVLICCPVIKKIRSGVGRAGLLQSAADVSGCVF